MRHFEPLITPAEAVDLFGYSEPTLIGADTAYAYIESRKGERIDLTATFCCVWNAGRIQGIREERHAQNEKKLAAEMHKKPIGRLQIEGGLTIPLFEINNGYSDTLEGSKLYAAYLRAKHAYEEGKQTYEESHK